MNLDKLKQLPLFKKNQLEDYIDYEYMVNMSGHIGDLPKLHYNLDLKSSSNLIKRYNKDE